MALVRSLKEIRIYSPTPASASGSRRSSRSGLASTFAPLTTRAPPCAAHTLFGTATNSLTPVLDADWLEPNAHVTCVKELELDDRILERSAQVIVHTRLGAAGHYIIGKGDEPIYDHDPKEGLAEDLQKIRGARKKPPRS